MKAAVVPAVNGRWEVKEWQTPKAGPNQVVIRMHVSGLCYTDVHTTHGCFRHNFHGCSVMNQWARLWRLAPE